MNTLNNITKGEAMKTIDEVLEQAFVDGSSDTMWQGERSIEIFATAKAELEQAIATMILEARIDEVF